MNLTPQERTTRKKRKDFKKKMGHRGKYFTH